MPSNRLKLTKLNASDAIEQFKLNSLYNLPDKSSSFFTDKAWVNTWLICLPNDISAGVYLLQEDSNLDPAIIFPGTVQSARRFGISATYLHCGATGNSQLDDLVIEKNSPRIVFPENTFSLQQLLNNANADIFSLPGIAEADYQTLQSRLSIDCWKTFTETKKSYIVNLEKVRSTNKETGYLSLLSSNKRRQIRKSISLYEELGEITTTEPGTTEEALFFFDELCQLHQKEWVKRGEEGAFSGEFLKQFHRRLISDYFNDGNIRLFKITAGSVVIGIVYGFISNNEFLYYQSGFNYSEDNRFKPGLSCHYLLIEKMAAEGLAVYDFLIGDYDYKKSLCTDTYNMLWITCYSNNWRAKLTYFSKHVLTGLKSGGH